MANSATDDLMSLGQHCDFPACRQIDFLPFKCDCCGRTYCLEHRTYSAHQCALAVGKECTTIVCPMCARAVKLSVGQDPNMAFDAHVREGCDPSNYAKVYKKQKCPVESCKEKLTTITRYKCKKCGQIVCLKHRDPADHSCEVYQSQQRNANATRLSQLVQPTQNSSVVPQLVQPTQKSSAVPPAKQPTSRATASARAQYDSIDNSIRGTAQRRMQQPQVSASSLPEVCPQCSARFGTVAQLIQHAEEWHPSASTSNPAFNSHGREVFDCHKCGKSFGNAVALVEHSERCGTSANKSECVLS